MVGPCRGMPTRRLDPHHLAVTALGPIQWAGGALSFTWI